MARFRALDLHVDAKPDLTPVSDADTAVEKAIRATLARARPRDGVLGEEYGLSAPAAGPGSRQWVIDPIDGTKNFIRGVPIWAHADRADGGRHAGGRPGLRPRAGPPVVGRDRAGRVRRAAPARRPPGSRSPAVRRLADASFCYSSLNGWEESGRLEPMLDIMPRRRGAAGRTATSTATCCSPRAPWTSMVEPELSLWDVAALIPIVTEAGGTFTDLDGRSGPGGGSAIATNGHLHPTCSSRTRAHVVPDRETAVYPLRMSPRLVLPGGHDRGVRGGQPAPVGRRGAHHRAPHVRSRAAAAAGRAAHLSVRSALPDARLPASPSWPAGTCRCSWCRPASPPGSG